MELLRQCNVSQISIIKNDAVDVQSLENYSHILLSPGPATPSESGNLLSLIQHAYKHKPILGICLGHQAIAEVFGGKLINLKEPRHGYRTNLSRIKPCKLFREIPSNLQVGLYHSWVVDETNFPEELEVTAYSEDGLIMGLQHKELPVYGVQFHPESFMTEHGLKLIQNFLY